jgi:hypothetical protein
MEINRQKIKSGEPEYICPNKYSFACTNALPGESATITGQGTGFLAFRL